jgi:hypothetical protein
MLQPSRRHVLALLATSALAGPLMGTAAAQAPVRPVNQAPRDPALVKVIAAMLAAAKARDFKRLSPHVVARIQLDFGGGVGRAEFGRRLARHPAAWDELVWVLENGGQFEKDGSFVAPYTFSADTGKLDPFESGVLVAKIKAHAAPRADAPVVAELDHSVVKVTDWKRTDQTPSPFYRRQDWVEIELAGPRKAWVPAKYVRSSVDFRAGFVKVRGVWKMNTFIAGD